MWESMCGGGDGVLSDLSLQRGWIFHMLGKSERVSLVGREDGDQITDGCSMTVECCKCFGGGVERLAVSGLNWI